MPGVECGDIGPKVAYDSKDNGYLILNQVRIPRRNMLMRFVKVSKEGDFSIEGDIRILYSVMMFIRVILINTEAMSLAQALTISLRYSAVRRQFATQEGTKKERRILDYQAHHFKVIPPLAFTYMMRFASIEVHNLYNTLMEDIQKEDFSKLELMHHYASGFKSMFTEATHVRIEQLRQTLGGVGFSDFAGISEILREDYPGVTFEGDTTIMIQQAARYLMKTVKSVGRGAEPKFPMEYLKDLKTVEKRQGAALSFHDYLRIDVLEDALATRSNLMVGSTMLKLA